MVLLSEKDKVGRNIKHPRLLQAGTTSPLYIEHLVEVRYSLPFFITNSCSQDSGYEPTLHLLDYTEGFYCTVLFHMVKL